MTEYKKTIAWRQRAKIRLIAAFGGGCGICGYNRYPGSLVFHHINPEEKDFAFGRFRSLGWNRIVLEVRKCVMLCSNCHGEVHAGLSSIEMCPRFNEEFADYRKRTDSAGEEVTLSM
jgi:hypothetical protein